MKIKKDFYIKLFFYILIGAYGAGIDLAMSNFFYNDIIPSIIKNAPLFKFISDFGLVPTLAGIIGAIAGLINNFLMNEYFVHDIKGDRRTVRLRFYKYLTTIILSSFLFGNVIILNIGIWVFGFGFTTSKLIAILLSTFINYPINYFWTWKNFEKS